MESFDSGFWPARSWKFYRQPVINLLLWLRMFPDTVFIVVGALPIAAAAVYGFFHMRPANDHRWMPNSRRQTGARCNTPMPGRQRPVLFRRVRYSLRGSNLPRMDKVEALRRTPLFGGLTLPELHALAECAVEQKLSKGEILFLAGDAARGLYVIVEGAVRAFRVGSDGREQVIHVEKAGATVGEVPMFDEGTYPSNAGGEEDSLLLFLPGKDVRRSILDHPQIALSALKVLARRIRNCAELVETLSLHDVDRRLAKLLLAEARTGGVRRGHGLEFEFSLTHQQVASRIGSVREVVSRAFGRLQQAGFIRVEGKRVLLADVERFRNYSEGQ